MKKVFNGRITKYVLLLMGAALLIGIVAGSWADQRGERYAHLSFDDAIGIFEDLTTNRYDSIFENDLLKFCKDMHDEYGAVFSFYVFNKYSGFSISKCTDRYSKEFSDNSDWLKFGFHSYDGKGYGDTSAKTASQEYSGTIAELIRITGSQASIDRIPRLQFFSGNLESVLAMKACEYGITGLLSSDDDRMSYYLDETQNDALRASEVYVEPSSGLYMFPTDLRLEHIDNIEDALALLNPAGGNGKIHYLIVFTHEWAFTPEIEAKVSAVCRYALANGFQFGYPMNWIDNGA